MYQSSVNFEMPVVREAFENTLGQNSDDHFDRVIAQSASLRSHQDVFEWLQGDVQRHLPHQIMVSAWGDFDRGHLQHDIISSLAGVRSQHVNSKALAPLVTRCFAKWGENGGQAFVLSAGTRGFLLDSDGLDCNLTCALRQMRSVLVHAVQDLRRNEVCLYLAFNTADKFDAAQCSAIQSMLPHLDNALRQVATLPAVKYPAHIPQKLTPGRHKRVERLTQRELEILQWIALGKTNPEIGCILDLSLYTVKNHIQRMFRKLNVSNRAQAVAEVAQND
ncbi:LuxR C-terminal-related transcriptional regulator [Curvibacter sp. APW13]|uniref:XrtB/PEP-CTERM-associated transcriptional regulator EpsA n=1 Tax=Curvibacter sp. APW13 TaxID=3077236 RepID=UPI0028DED464|nr:XrtB/PEP-CTERM-associated transcriptional regulator EpsA [Curvibacter sp. APW13]MDT8992583.1 LuxR C-terminal-related transcriptional regulator [Curvibacter sp. APW13]